VRLSFSCLQQTLGDGIRAPVCSFTPVALGCLARCVAMCALDVLTYSFSLTFTPLSRTPSHPSPPSPPVVAARRASLDAQFYLTPR
jgi:hypothetical protein